MSEWNAQVIEEFRANDGKVSGWFADKTVLILHATGARSGQERLTPLVYRKEGDRVFVAASRRRRDGFLSSDDMAEVSVIRSLAMTAGETVLAVRFLAPADDLGLPLVLAA